MTGYLNNPTATAETVDDDGWLHTGDIAIIDEHAHMTIVDRMKELKTVTLEDIQALVSENLVSYKQIRTFEVIDAIPKSASGKILRKDLRNKA
ncbi:UNVERIFIED_CONTAM: hypothetical protein GTU68_042179 [Idotea baltica]|nr:hypothetical protein [Idotea baltica]